MIEESGVVVAVSGAFAEVRTQRRGACGACAADGVCGTSLFDRLLGRRPVLLRVRNPAAAQVGERVVVGIAEQGLVAAALAAYLVPILGLLLGALVGQVLGENLIAGSGDLPSLFGGGLGLGLALFWLRRYSAGVAGDPGRQPVILRQEPGPPNPCYFF